MIRIYEMADKPNDALEDAVFKILNTNNGESKLITLDGNKTIRVIGTYSDSADGGPYDLDITITTPLYTNNIRVPITTEYKSLLNTIKYYLNKQ